MKGLITNTALIITALFALLLLVANLAQFIPPTTIAVPQILGIIYPYILAINVLIAILWITKLKLVFIIPLSVIIFGYKHITTLVKIDFFNNEDLVKEQTIKVVSFNVRLFDLYNWSKNGDLRVKIIDYIKEINPDIVCFQEYYNDLTNEFETTQKLINLPNLKYCKIAPTYIAKGLYQFGIATFSKYPITGSGEIIFQNSQNNAIWTDLLIAGDTIRVYNIHMQSNHLETDDYEFIHRINNSPTSIEIKQIKNFFKRLNIAYRKRSEQAIQVREHIKLSKYPSIVCADLNDTHISYTYNKVRNNFNDAFQQSGTGFGHTFGNLLTSVRIDYIFYDKNFRAKSYKTGPGDLSDHKPVICTLQQTSKK